MSCSRSPSTRFIATPLANSSASRVNDPAVTTMPPVACSAANTTLAHHGARASSSSSLPSRRAILTRCPGPWPMLPPCFLSASMEFDRFLSASARRHWWTRAPSRARGRRSRSTRKHLRGHAVKGDAGRETPWAEDMEVKRAAAAEPKSGKLERDRRGDALGPYLARSGGRSCVLPVESPGVDVLRSARGRRDRIVVDGRGG